MIERRRGRPLRLLQTRELSTRRRDLFLKRRALVRCRLVRGLEHGQHVQRRGEVIGEQAGLRVAHARLDEGRAPGNARLAGQGPELAVDLVRQVQDAHEVRVHVRQLLECPLLTAPMLQDARGLFDETAALLGGGGQDRVKLSLADDDVHLAPHARVRK